MNKGIKGVTAKLVLAEGMRLTGGLALGTSLAEGFVGETCGSFST